LAKQKDPSPYTPITQQNVKTLKCPIVRKTLRIGKNGVKEDLMVFPSVNKLFPKDCQMKPITFTTLTEEKPPITYTHYVSRGLEKLNVIFLHTNLIPQNFVLPNLVTLKTISDHHHPPITSSYFYCEIVTF
jgi:hypothetical protein